MKKHRHLVAKLCRFKEFHQCEEFSLTQKNTDCKDQ